MKVFITLCEIQAIFFYVTSKIQIFLTEEFLD